MVYAEAMAATPLLAEDEEGDVLVETTLVVRKGTTRPMGQEGSLIPWTHQDGREETKRDLRTYRHPTWVRRQHVTLFKRALRGNVGISPISAWCALPGGFSAGNDAHTVRSLSIYREYRLG